MAKDSGRLRGDDPAGFLDHGGEMAARMRAFDWSTTPLGPPETWPQSLKTAVRILLTSRFAMWMFWGPELTFFCNDAYLPTTGVKRDWVLGARSDRVWAEIWDDLAPRIDQVMKTGEATWDEALKLYLERSGFQEETYHTFSYSPLADDHGVVSGMLCVVAEVTDRVLGERQLASLRELGARLASAASRADVMAALEAALRERPEDIPFAAAYLAVKDEGVAELAALHGLSGDSAPTPTLIRLDDPDALWPLADVDAGPAFIEVGPGMAKGLRLTHWQTPPKAALITAMRSSEEAAPVGYLVAGINPHRALDTEYLGFIELFSAQVAAAIARADDYERERERARALAEIDRAKTAFFSNVSHEFRTPLTLMLGPLEDALADGDGVEPTQRERIDLAHRNALRLLRLVNSLLDFSRIEAGRVSASFRPTDLAALTAEIASSFRSATDRAGLKLIVAAPALSQPVYVDREMWEKIVLNLMSNAFKFTFEGEIEVTLGEADGQARLSVRDTGTGIPESELPKLFDRFHRVEGAEGRSFEGSGIGLALVQELVKQHQGEIAVASAVGEGTTFTVSVPLGHAHIPEDAIEDAPQERTSAVRAQSFVEEALRWLPGEVDGDALLDAGAARDYPIEAPPAAARRTERRRVLLADDNADLRAYIARLLAERGYQVETVSDGRAALEALRRARPDLLVTDVMMPNLDGFGLLRAVRDDTQLRDLPVIMLSARAGEEAKVEGLDAGADDYLTKPFSARELLARVSANLAMAKLRTEAAEAIRMSEAREREQAERVQLALDAGAILGTWVWNVESDILTADERFARSFGVDAEACAAGLPLSALMEAIHPEDRERVGAEVNAAVERGGAYRCEYRVRQADGSYRWIEANGRVDKDGEGGAARFPGVLIDAEHRRAIERALRDLNEELESRVAGAIAERERVEEALRQAQKMEAVGQLTGGIAHDFNNLLTVITGNVDMARRALGAGEGARAVRAMDNAQKGAERAAALTQRLLAFSRRQPLAPKSLSVDRLVADMADLLHRSLGETVALETISSPGLWRVEADPNQLENAILNLAVNARDAMPDGGKLTIETANAHLSRQYAATHAEVAPGSYVVIAVTDTGCGMGKETLARVFDPFFTTKEVGKGTGLGLSMVYGFVKQSGGHIKIYSEENEGTTVKIYLPRVMSGAVEEDAAQPLADRGRRDQSILVVEDDDDVRAYTVEILRELGYRVLEAHDGAAALRLLERREQPLDLLFTDVVMPAMSGRELADRARQIQPDLKVLYTSGYTRNAIVHGGRLEAGVEMISKPFTYHALAEKIADVLDTGRTGRVLVAEHDATVRMFAVEALAEAGFHVDEAATAQEALNCVRAAEGRYDAVLIDLSLPDRAGESLAGELRALHADMPMLLTNAERLDAVSDRLAGDRCVGVVTRPFNAAKLQAALASLNVRCGT
jgi:PAS domain S-box-containing protein